MKHDLPVNEPTGVAEIIVGAAAQTGMNGKAIYIEGNRAWDIEENIDKLSPQWMGEQQTKDFYSGIGLIQSVRQGHRFCSPDADRMVGRMGSDMKAG